MTGNCQPKLSLGESNNYDESVGRIELYHLPVRPHHQDRRSRGTSLRTRLKQVFEQEADGVF